MYHLIINWELKGNFKLGLNTCPLYFKVASKITRDFEAECSLFTYNCCYFVVVVAVGGVVVVKLRQLDHTTSTFFNLIASKSRPNKNTLHDCCTYCGCSPLQLVKTKRP